MKMIILLNSMNVEQIEDLFLEKLFETEIIHQFKSDYIHLKKNEKKPPLN